MFATEGTLRETHRRSAARRWSWQHFAAVSGVLAISLGVFLCSRRATGAASTFPQFEVVAFTALILVAWAWLVRVSFWRLTLAASIQSLSSEVRSPASIAAIWIPVVAIALFAIACSFPFALADCIVWSVALAAVLWGPRLPLLARHSSPDIDGEISAENVLQELSRYRLGDGREAVHGTLTAHFAAGERGTTLYVGFCPPFERLPQVEASVIDGPPATVKLAQVLHQGAQVELRLSRIADRQQRVNIRLSAVELAAAEPEKPSEK